MVEVRIFLITLGLIVAQLVAGTASAQTIITNGIQSVSPTTAPQGATNLTVTFNLDPSAIPPVPPNTVPPASATIGTIAGTGLAHPSQYIVTGQFNIPLAEPTGLKTVAVVFPSPGGTLTYNRLAAFDIGAGSSVLANFTATPTTTYVPGLVTFTDVSTGNITNRFWSFGDRTTTNVTETELTHRYEATDRYTVSLTVSGPGGSNTLTRFHYIAAISPQSLQYLIVDTGQSNCYNNTTTIAAPAAGQPFSGQDAQHDGHQPQYVDNGDGTITDLTTGLMWQKDPGAKVTYAEAVSGAAALNLGGYTDWRLPTIKELYSLILFSGTDVSPCMEGSDCPGAVPFLDTNYFVFQYGDTNAGERIIDAQYWSSTEYVSTTMGGAATVFGVNFADGRIKGYPRDTGPGDTPFTEFVRYVRGNVGYGISRFGFVGNGTVTDFSTGLMWTQADSGAGMTWSNALVWVQAKNATNYLGHSDWRLPNTKELQSIIDYSRSPDTTNSAAINPLFSCTAITNEAGAVDYPYYWTSTTHADANGGGAWGAYLCFGRAMGYMNSTWQDVHGAGAQRSDPKTGNPADYPTGHGPQGDAVRIYNFVRLVRDGSTSRFPWFFAVIGDTHITNSTGYLPEICSSMRRDAVSLVLITGDLVEGGAGLSVEQLEAQLTTWRTGMASLYNVGYTDVYAVRGNHENDVTNNITAWNNVFTGSYAFPSNGPPGESNLTYAFSYYNALFIGLDNYANIHRVNQAWLNQQLATNRLPHVFVFGHEPAFKAFHTDCLDDFPAERNAFWSSLAAAGARVYFSGHDHFFDLARISDGDGNPSNDLYQCIVGTGGGATMTNYNYNGANAPYAPVNLYHEDPIGYVLVMISGFGTNDLEVTMWWKQRTFDPNIGMYRYVATTNSISYVAVSRTADTVGDGIPDWWRAQYFGGDGTTTNAMSCATCDPSGNGQNNLFKYLADLNPTNPASSLAIINIAAATNDVSLIWTGGANAWQYLECAGNLTNWTAIFTNVPPTAVTNSIVHTGAAGASNLFYRVKARRLP